MSEGIELHPEVNSIVDFLYHRFKAKIYVYEVPQGFAVPAYYVPSMSSFGGSDTVSTYSKSYTLNLKIFHESQYEAVSVAESLQDECERERLLFPLRDDEGLETGDYVRIERIDVRPGDGPTATMVFQWTSRYHYRKAEYINIENFTIEGGLKDEQS